jgi:hypothetical protein
MKDIAISNALKIFMEVPILQTSVNIVNHNVKIVLLIQVIVFNANQKEDIKAFF